MPPPPKQPTSYLAVEEHYSPAQVADKLGVHRLTVCTWIRQGKIKPVRKLGKRIVRIPASALNRFLNARTTT